jgi:hypothetical protein
VDPWPGGSGNPCPTTSPDKRVGDGSYGGSDTSVTNAYGTDTTDAGAGTDFACSGIAIFPAARGQYHQSNLQHVRYHQLANRGEDLPGDDGTGQDPFYTPQMNDLLWAEGLIRSNGDRALAAAKINNSRVGRGGLSALTGAEGDSTLIAALQYEQEIEFMGQGIDPFFNRRRSGFNKAAQTGWPNTGTPQYVDGLIVGTPRHMPVPAKELNILLRAVYTFGGPSAPDMAGTVTTPDGVRRQTVAQRFKELEDARPNGVQRWLMTHSDRLF